MCRHTVVVPTQLSCWHNESITIGWYHWPWCNLSWVDIKNMYRYCISKILVPMRNVTKDISILHVTYYTHRHSAYTGMRTDELMCQNINIVKYATAE